MSKLEPEGEEQLRLIEEKVSEIERRIKRLSAKYPTSPGTKPKPAREA